MFGKIKNSFKKHQFKFKTFKGSEILKAANEGTTLHVNDVIDLHVIYHSDWLKLMKHVRMCETYLQRPKVAQ